MVSNGNGNKSNSNLYVSAALELINLFRLHQCTIMIKWILQIHYDHKNLTNSSHFASKHHIGQLGEEFGLCEKKGIC